MSDANQSDGIVPHDLPSSVAILVTDVVAVVAMIKLEAILEDLMPFQSAPNSSM